MILKLFIIFTCPTLIYFFITLVFDSAHFPHIVIDNITAIRNVSDKFLSIAIDSHLIRTGDICILNVDKFLQRSLPLTPAYLRIGGNDADRLIFYNNYTPDHSFICQIPGFEVQINDNKSNFTMSDLVWSDINDFARKSGYKLIFDLNVLIRKNGHWDSSNAEILINHSNANNYEVIWQLGNEPNSFLHVFGTSINPMQLGQDFQELRRILHNFPCYKNSFIIGPDVTRPKNLGVDALMFLRKFLCSANTSIDAVTWHQYYLHGGTATLQDFINPDTLNLLQEEIAAIHKIVEECSPSKPIWLSETGSASGGGAPGLSDTFVAGFLWLDKLGIAALAGVSVVIRQSLYGSHYSLLDTQSLAPLPDWWLSILYKKLVGRTVLSIEPFIDVKGTVRMYAHCSSDVERSLKGSIVTLFGMNLNNKPSFIQIMKSFETHKKAYISAYVLTGTDGPLSKTVKLNGKELQLLSDGTLPELKPTTQELSFIILSPMSLGFWTIHGINMVSCP